jgi:hypothetical protein
MEWRLYAVEHDYQRDEPLYSKLVDLGFAFTTSCLGDEWSFLGDAMIVIRLDTLEDLIMLNQTLGVPLILDARDQTITLAEPPYLKGEDPTYGLGLPFDPAWLARLRLPMQSSP